MIDPSLGIDAVRDVAIAGGRIAAVDANLTADAADTIEARGRIVRAAWRRAGRRIEAGSAI